MTERSVLRAHLMRNTVHLVTAEDFLTFRTDPSRFIPLPAPARDAIAGEGRRLLEFAARGAEHDVRFAPRA